MTFSKILEPFLVLLGLVHFKFKSSKYCYSSADNIKLNQYEKLKKLICVSYDEIPFYNEKYKKSNFNPHTDFNSLSDMKLIPILSKTEAREYQDNLVNNKRSKYALTFLTSGSTGHPFKAVISPSHWIIEQSCVWRHWSWADYKLRDRVAIVRSYVPEDDSKLVKWDKLRNFIYFSPFHLSDKHIEEYLKKMVELKIVFLRGYPSSILAIADFVRRHPDVKIPKLKAVLTASERLGYVHKNIIESALKAEVFNHYGLAEQIVMFGSCENGTHMHNYEEYGYLELLDTDTDNLKKIIGTNLNNYAMPLIRYETGDLAEVDNSICNCQRVGNAILNVVGREDSNIILLDGSKIPVTNFYTMFEYYGDYFSSWQLVQKKNGNLLVIVDIYRIEDIDFVSSKLTHDIKSRLGDKIDFTFDFSGGFYQVGEGKRNPFLRMSSS